VILRDRLAYALVALGLVQMVGYGVGSRAVRGLGAASVASPLPIVFSDVRGLETFASDFVLEVTTKAGVRRFEVTPSLYERFGGPYNRRNVYGAAISYGPILPAPLWQSVLRYAFCAPGTLAHDLGVGDGVEAAEVLVTTGTRGRTGAWKLGVTCGD
jgi:hypothetical protein